MPILILRHCTLTPDISHLSIFMSAPQETLGGLYFSLYSGCRDWLLACTAQILFVL